LRDRPGGRCADSCNRAKLLNRHVNWKGGKNQAKQASASDDFLRTIYFGYALQVDKWPLPAVIVSSRRRFWRVATAVRQLRSGAKGHPLTQMTAAVLWIDPNAKKKAMVSRFIST